MKIIVQSLRGGTGSSTVCSALAVQLAKTGDSVLLADNNFPSPYASVYGISDALLNDKNLELISIGPELDYIRTYGKNWLGDLLTADVLNYRFTIVDFGCRARTAPEFFSEADIIVTVVEPDSNCVQRLVGELGGVHPKEYFLFNKVRQHSEISARFLDFFQTLEGDVIHIVPHVIPWDDFVGDAQQHNKELVVSYPHAQSTQKLISVAQWLNALRKGRLLRSEEEKKKDLLL